MYSRAEQQGKGTDSCPEIKTTQNLADSHRRIGYSIDFQRLCIRATQNNHTNCKYGNPKNQ